MQTVQKLLPNLPVFEHFFLAIYTLALTIALNNVDILPAVTPYAVTLPGSPPDILFMSYGF